MSEIPRTVTHRFLEIVPRFQKVLNEALSKQTKEPGTRAIVADMFEEILGYDKYNDLVFDLIDAEKKDLVVKFNDQPVFAVEVVAINAKLNERHLRETKNLALDQHIPWLILTNSIEWQVYRVDPEAALSLAPIFQFNFLKINKRNKQHQYWLFLLSKEGFRKNALDQYYEHAQVVNPFTVSVLLQSDWVAGRIADELKRLNPKLVVTSSEIAKIITGVILPERFSKGKAFNKAKFTIQQLYKKLEE